MFKSYIKTVEDHLWKICRIAAEVLGRKLAHRGSTNVTVGLTPASLVFGRELRLPCDLLLGAPPDKEVLRFNHAANSVDHLHGIHNYVRQHLNLASDRMDPRYDRMTNCGGYKEGDTVWLYRLTRKNGKSPKLQSSFEGPHKIVTRINRWYTGSRETLNRRWWWYVWAGSHLIRELLGTRDLKEGAVRAVAQ
jgi:hypothetical protein